MDDDLRGVKGWLLTFVIIIALVSPGLSALETWRELHSGATAEFSNIPIFASIRILAWGTVAFAALVGWFVVPFITLKRNLRRKPAHLLSNHTETLDVAAQLGFKPAGRGRK